MVDQVNTLDFSGDATTFLGFIGVTSSLLIIMVAFRRFFNSPYNVRYVRRESVTTSDSGTISSDSDDSMVMDSTSGDQ